MPSDEYDRNRPPRAPKMLLKIETADARQAHIEDKTTGTISCFFSPELFRRFKSNRVQTGRLKKSLDGCTYTRIIVNYVHCWDSCRCHLPPLGTSRPRCRRERRIYPVSTPELFPRQAFPFTLRRVLHRWAARGRALLHQLCKLASYPTGRMTSAIDMQRTVTPSKTRCKSRYWRSRQDRGGVSNRRLPHQGRAT